MLGGYAHKHLVCWMCQGSLYLGSEAEVGYLDGHSIVLTSTTPSQRTTTSGTCTYATIGYFRKRSMGLVGLKIILKAPRRSYELVQVARHLATTTHHIITIVVIAAVTAHEKQRMFAFARLQTYWQIHLLSLASTDTWQRRFPRSHEPRVGRPAPGVTGPRRWLTRLRPGIQNTSSS